MEAKLLREKPFPVWLCPVHDQSALDRLDTFELELALGTYGFAYRGISTDRLAVVMRTGVDVEPPDAPLYVSHDLDKALEYGGLPKVVLVLRPDHLDRTYREVPAATPDPELSILRNTFPTVEVSTDGSMLWMSRLGSDDPRRGPAYEGEYGRWIPGPALDAIHAVLIFGDETTWDQHL